MQPTCGTCWIPETGENVTEGQCAMQNKFEEARKKAIESIRVSFECFVERYDTPTGPELYEIIFRWFRLDSTIDAANIFGLISREEAKDFRSSLETLRREAYIISGYEHLVNEDDE